MPHYSLGKSSVKNRQLLMSKEELIALLHDPVQTGQAVDGLCRLVEKYPYFHTAHQLYLKGLQQTDEHKMTLQLRKTALCVCNRSVLYNYIQNEANREKTNNDLIDVFLKSNPKIVPDDEQVYLVDLSEGLKEIPDISTDTLAEIYASQGHIGKAIEIYEHLILKYPEKHIYFAAQIERLKVKK